ncbi:MAG: nitrate reductase subunit beta [Desulfomonile tiedjei]|nr:nitrate reductase subunit beta [Desulfomonile tiedjei]
MRIRAQIAMVMNLDKCIGCHTCSIPCKHVWTTRPGAEYMWFNNVETKPGVGYPRRWEDQNVYRGGWVADRQELHLRAGGRVEKLLKIFHNPDLPAIDEYYSPWTYDYEKLISSPLRSQQPAARPVSAITGERTEITWGPSWEDDLAGVNTTGLEDVNFKDLDAKAYLQFKDVFMFYLPRICEHCLNPACVGSCPSGALYKREEDGIVLVDQERCRGWRYCVSGCPYKKVYFNWKAGRSEKCLFCYPRVESGLPTLCAQSCVGRIRYIGPVLYDADRIMDAASVADDQGVYEAQLAILLNPHEPAVVDAARSQGLPENFLTAAQASPVYKLAVEWKVAFPPHPEFRTLPMVWYVPPLSPMVQWDEKRESCADVLDSMRIPVKYLANLLTAGDEAPLRAGLKRLMALRDYMRSVRVENRADAAALEAVGLSESAAQEMYRLLALAKYADRYVIPTTSREGSEDLHNARGCFGFSEP